MSENNAVNHPNHYNTGKIEIIDFIEDRQYDFHLGNAVKYICRAGKKDPNKYLEDVAKAKWYLQRRLTMQQPITIGIGSIIGTDFLQDTRLKGYLFKAMFSLIVAGVFEPGQDTEAYIRSHISVAIACLNSELK